MAQDYDAQPSSETSCLDRPAWAVVAAEKVVGGEDIGDAHVGGVVVDLFSGAKSDYAEEHDLGEAGGVVEGRGGFVFSLGGIDPVQFVVLVGDAGELLGRLPEGVVERLAQKAGPIAVSVVEEFAFGSAVQRAAFLVQFSVAVFFWLVWLASAVAPVNLDRC